LRDEKDQSGQRGSAMIIVLLMTMLMLLLGAGLLATSETELSIAANDHWSEGAFQAAEAAVQVSIDQLDIGATNLVVNDTQIGEMFSFRSGGREDDAPQPPQLVGLAPAAGYTVDSSSSYDSTSYVFEIYRIQGTGTGPRNTTREVEVRVEMGPVAE
jgi:hypothetical protein